jgi:hypothetical protein
VCIRSQIALLCHVFERYEYGYSRYSLTHVAPVELPAARILTPGVNRQPSDVILPSIHW